MQKRVEVTTLPLAAANKTNGSLPLLIQDVLAINPKGKDCRTPEFCFSTVMQFTQDGFLALDHELRVAEANESLCQISGYTRDELLGMHVSKLDSTETHDICSARIKRIQTNGSEIFETSLRRKDGTYVDMEISVSQLSLGNWLFISFCRNVTERKKAELARTEEAVRRRILFEQAKDGIVIIGNDLQVIDANKAFADMLGYTLEEMHQLHVWDWEAFYPTPEDMLRVWPEFPAYSCTFESKHRRKDGSIYDVEISWNPAEYDGQKHLYCVCRDVTERKQAEAERERLMAAIEQVGETVVITNPSGDILYANPAFERVTGYTLSEAMGQNPRVLKSGQHDEAFYRTLWHTISSGYTWQGRFINKRKDGRLYTELALISPVCDHSGRIVNYVAVKRDITHEIETEQQLLHAQKMESIGRLAGGVAHDFNNLLTAIISYAEMSRNKIEEDHPIRSWLDEITRASERSADITRQLLAFAKKQPITPRVLDLNETVAELIKLLRRLIGEDIELAWVSGPSLWPVKFDQTQLGQILTNLCVNSRDAIANTGKITIETRNVSLDNTYCASHPGAASGEYVMLVVSDDGSGMEKDVLEHIFDPFFTTKELGKGTGLGLATVYGIIKQNSGHINVYSEPGEGTTFRIYLPRYYGNGQIASIGTSSNTPRGNGETVLIVEDEPSLRATCAMLLDSLGYKVVIADNPKLAYDIFLQHPENIDMLLTDIIMPGMNGVELSRLLSAIKPKLKVLYMSGYTADMISRYGALEQLVHFIEKPFTIDRLARKVREAMEIK